MPEYQVGDRVRTLVANKNVPAETKGTIIFCDKSGSVIETVVDGIKTEASYGNDQLEKMIVVFASHGEIERTRSLHGNSFAGLNLPEELLECQSHINTLKDCGYSYKFMQDYLMSMGYAYAIIRKAFKNVTGMTPEDAVNINAIYTPGSIPQFNYGWGYAKKGKDIVFIMSIANKYCIFEQKDDMNRVEVSSFEDLKEAVDKAEKMVKKLERWNPPVKDIKTNMDASQMYKEPQLFMQAQDIQEWESRLSRYSSKTEKAALIRQAFLEGMIDANTRKMLLKHFADAEDEMEKEAVTEKLNEIEKEKMGKSIKDEISEKSPAQYFEKQKLQHKFTTVPADAVESVLLFLNTANEEISDFNISLHSLKYASIQPQKKSAPAHGETDILSATASISVLLEITDGKGAEVCPKLGLMVFSVIGNQLFTTDTFKGEDDQIYALSNEGCEKLFQIEHELKVQTR